ncbi:hypothetical protein N9X61_00705 [Sulfurimonas sp.]|nr:hypothetical protein [Sulfurimonas sp.]
MKLNRLITKLFFIGLVFFTLNGNVQASAIWCEKNYNWVEKKNVFPAGYDDGSYTGLEFEIEDINLFQTYDNTIGNVYAKTTTDFILEYINHNGETKRIIIKGQRASQTIYEDMKSHFTNGYNLSKYLTCNQKYSADLSRSVAYNKTSFNINVKDGTEYTLTRGGTDYAMNHNVALVLSYLASSITTASNSDDVFSALSAYFAKNVSGGGYAIYLKLKNANNFFDRMKIAKDEVLIILKALVADNQKYGYVIDAGDILISELESINTNITSDNPNYNTGELVVVESSQNIFLKVLDKGGEEAFDALFDYTGLSPYKNASEALANFLIASNLLMDMGKESFSKVGHYESHKFEDVPYDYSNVSQAVYYLLSKHSINSPQSTNGYLFNVNTNVRGDEFSTILVNTFLYDDYKQNGYTDKLAYVNDKFYFWYGTGIDANDDITLDTANKLLKKAYELKIDILTQGNQYKVEVKDLLIDGWDSFDIAKGKIMNLNNNDILTRGNIAVLIYSASSQDWDELIQNKIDEINEQKNTVLTGRGAVLPYYSLDKLDLVSPQSEYHYTFNIKNQD